MKQKICLVILNGGIYIHILLKINKCVCLGALYIQSIYACYDKNINIYN